MLNGQRGSLPASVTNTQLFCEPWPYNPAAGTPLQPSIWFSESSSSHCSSSPEDCFSQTPVAKGVIVTLRCSSPRVSAGEFRSLHLFHCFVAYSFCDPARFVLTPFTTGVCEQIFLWRKRDVRRQVLRVPNQGSRAVSGAGLQGKGSCKRSDFFTDTSTTAFALSRE